MSSIEFLGVIISDTLTWSTHIRYLTNKLSKITGSLYKLRPVIPTTMYSNIYYALVNSQLNYGITLCGSKGSTSRLSSLFSAQKKCIRTLYRIKRISKNIPGHTKTTFNNNNIPTIHNLYYLNILTEHLNIFTLIVNLTQSKIAYDPIYLIEIKLFSRYRSCGFLNTKITSRI